MSTITSYKTIFVLFLVSLFAACKPGGPDDGIVPSPDEPASTPVQRELGQPLPGSTAITKVIGANGGEIASADQTIRITIPAGAVSENTTFSVQEVTNTLTGQSRSFRLLPHSVSFKKPVTLSFSYDKLDLTGTNADLLQLAYQDEQGFYHPAKATANDQTNKRLTVQTTHFSDWNIYELYKLMGSRYVKRGGEVELTVKCYSEKPVYVEGPDGNLYEDVWSTVQAVKKTEWSLIGEGKLTPFKLRSVYQAPSTIPAVNPVTVSVRLIGEFDNTGKSEIILMQPIAIEGEYFTLTMDGTKYELSDVVMVTTKDVLMVVGKYKDQLQVNLHMKANISPGVYEFHSPLTPRDYVSIDVINLTNLEDSYIQYRTGCSYSDPAFITSPGVLKITKAPAQAGEFLQGEISSATLYRSGNYCDHPIQRSISLKFSALQY